MLPPGAYVPGERNQRPTRRHQQQLQPQQQPRPPEPQPQADVPSRATRDMILEQLLLNNSRNYRPQPQPQSGGVPPVPNVGDAWDRSDEAVIEQMSKNMKEPGVFKKNYGRGGPPPDTRGGEGFSPLSAREIMRSLLTAGIVDPSNYERANRETLPPIHDGEHTIRQNDALMREPHSTKRGAVKPKMQRNPNQRFPDGVPAAQANEMMDQFAGNTPMNSQIGSFEGDTLRLLLEGQGGRI